MPTGIYLRSPEQLRKAKNNLAKGHEKEARDKATLKLREIAKNPDWRERVSMATKEAMRKPEIRKRHLTGLRKSFQKHGVNFKGGNGQPPTQTIRQLNRIFNQIGFTRELSIPTRIGHNTPGIPNNYKVDFGNIRTKMAIEIDGLSHRSQYRQKLDKKKTEILERLGWKVLRIKHK
jgi:hypothetical protein